MVEPAIDEPATRLHFEGGRAVPVVDRGEGEGKRRDQLESRETGARDRHHEKPPWVGTAREERHGDECVENGEGRFAGDDARTHRRWKHRKGNAAGGLQVIIVREDGGIRPQDAVQRNDCKHD